ncbi:hypothetical protein KI387_003840, partial [Taxus chinensis]
MDMVCNIRYLHFPSLAHEPNESFITRVEAEFICSVLRVEEARFNLVTLSKEGLIANDARLDFWDYKFAVTSFCNMENIILRCHFIIVADWHKKTTIMEDNFQFFKALWVTIEVLSSMVTSVGSDMHIFRHRLSNSKRLGTIVGMQLGNQVLVFQTLHLGQSKGLLQQVVITSLEDWMHIVSHELDKLLGLWTTVGWFVLAFTPVCARCRPVRARFRPVRARVLYLFVCVFYLRFLPDRGSLQ